MVLNLCQSFIKCRAFMFVYMFHWCLLCNSFSAVALVFTELDFFLLVSPKGWTKQNIQFKNPNLCISVSTCVPVCVDTDWHSLPFFNKSYSHYGFYRALICVNLYSYGLMSCLTEIERMQSFVTFHTQRDTEHFIFHDSTETSIKQIKRVFCFVQFMFKSSQALL